VLGLVIAIFVGIVVAIIVGAVQAIGQEQGNFKLRATPIIGSFIIAFLIVALFNTTVLVKAGHVGVVTRFGAVTGANFEQGLHFKVPFIEGVNIFDVRVMKEQVDAAAASKDLQEVKSTIALNYHLDSTQASTVYREIGPNYKERIVDPAVQEAFKFTTAQFTAEELITQREAVKSKARTFLKERLETFHIIVDELNIVNFDFSGEFNAAIEQKQVAQQNVEKAKQDLKRIEIEAQQKIAEAEGQAKAQRLQQQSLTTLYVQFKALEKWDGKLPTVTGGGVPFIKIPQGK
jgi:regulator of protease activity HflC (stomatin/prohibitin superfamily)